MAAITGKRGVLYLAASTGDAAAIAEQTDYTLELDQGIEDVSCLGSTWATHVLSGSRKWTASAKGNFDTGSQDLWNSAGLQTPARMYLYPDSAASSEFFSGLGWVKLGTVIAGGNSNAPKTAINITGDGELTHTVT